MSAKKVSVFYAHVASNIGDLAINEGEIAMLRRAFPDAELHFVALNSDSNASLPLARSIFDGSDNVRLTFYRTSFHHALIYETNPAQFLVDCDASDADLVLLSSGEHLFAYDNNDNDRNLYWRTLPILAAVSAEIACAVLPSTYGPFETARARQLIGATLQSADAFAAREPASAKLLAEQMKVDTCPVFPDPAFFLSPPIAPPQKQAGLLGLSMRSESWGIRLAAAEREASTSELFEHGYDNNISYTFSLALCEQHLSRDNANKVRLFIQTEADRALAEELRDTLREKGHADRVSVYRPESIQDYLNHLAELDVLVAARFHAVILGLVAGTHAVGVYFESHGHKMPGLFALFGLENHCFNLSQKDAGAAVDKVSSCLNADPESLDSTQARLAELREATIAWLQQITSQDVAPEVLWKAIQAYGALSGEMIRTSYDAVHGQEIEKLTSAQEEKDKLAEIELANLRRQAEATKSLEVRVTTSESELREVTRELTETKTLLDRAERDANAVRRELYRLQHRLQASTLYQLALETALTLKRRKGLLSLPKRLWAIYRSVQEQKMIDSDELFQAYGKRSWTRKKKVDPQVYLSRAPEQIIEDQAATSSDEEAASDLLTACKVFTDVEKLDAAIKLAKAALDRHPSEAAYRALFWALQNSGDLYSACQVIEDLESYLGPDAGFTQKDRLNRLKSQPAYQLALRGLVPEKATPAFDGNKGRICYVLHNSLPFSSGGYATRAQGLAQGLQKLGMEIIGLTRPGYPMDINSKLKRSDVDDVSNVNGILYVRTFEPSRKFVPLREFFPRAADVFVAHFEEYKPEYVVAASNYLSAMPALIAARRLGLPFVYEVRGFWEITRLSREPGFISTPAYIIQEVMEAFVCQHADRVLTLTEAMRQELIRRGVDGSKVDIVPNACEPEKFNPMPRDETLAGTLRIPSNVPVIGYVGTFVDYEGLDDLARACGLLKQKGVEFRLLLVGNENVSGTSRGSITETIANTAREQGFSDWLIMPGRVAHEKVAAYYSLIDIAPFPRKPWPVCEMVSPMKPLEAMAMEKTVVVSSVDALNEMVGEGKYGLVFEKNNVQALADTLARAIEDTDLRVSFGKRGRSYVLASRTWGRSAEMFADALENILIKTAPPA